MALNRSLYFLSLSLSLSHYYTVCTRVWVSKAIFHEQCYLFSGLILISQKIKFEFTVAVRISKEKLLILSNTTLASLPITLQFIASQELLRKLRSAIASSTTTTTTRERKIRNQMQKLFVECEFGIRQAYTIRCEYFPRCEIIISKIFTCWTFYILDLSNILREHFPLIVRWKVNEIKSLLAFNARRCSNEFCLFRSVVYCHCYMFMKTFSTLFACYIFV